MMGKIIYEPKDKMFGMWKIIRFSYVDSHHDAGFLCECTNCGEIYLVRGFALRNGKTNKCKSCAAKMR